MGNLVANFAVQAADFSPNTYLLMSFSRLMLGAVLWLAPSLSFSQPVNDGYHDDTRLPEGLRGQRIRALFDAVNANDPKAVEAFFERHVSASFRAVAPMDGHVEVFQSTFRRTGGLDFYSVRSYTPPRPNVVLIARDRLFGGWHGIFLNFSGPDERIEGLGFNPARPPKNAESETPLSEAELVADVRRKLETICARDAFSGAILLAKGDRILLESACGEASKSYHVANNVDTKFNLGSMNKMFTATAVLQLAERGKLRLDESIARFVDESWLPRSITSRVTVHHLLTHTSGLGSYFNDTYFNSSRDLFRQVDDYKSLVQGDTLSFEPGSRFQYSNTGMLLLGVVIEKASGENYFDYIRKYVYEPAGMLNTDCYELDRPQENLAEGYLPEGGGWKNNVFLHVLKGGPAGGGYSNVRDLHRFARALQSGGLVSKASLDVMWKNHSEAGYGYGFELEESPAGRVAGHGGGFPGLNSHLDIFRESGYILVVMSNYDRGAEPLRQYVKNLITTRLKN